MKSILKSLKQSARSMVVTVAAVFLMAAIFALPVPTASAATASSIAGHKPGLNDRYILTGIATRYNVVTGLDLNDNEITLLYCTIEDEYGETWVYSYELGSEVPPANQKLTLIMNANGTPNDIDDDVIEDILWCNCESVAEDD